MSNIVGISQRIGIYIIEQALDAALKGTFTTELAADLAATQFNGANRIKKAQAFIGHFTLRNPLFAFIKEHEEEYRMAIHHKDDRTAIFVALINARMSSATTSHPFSASFSMCKMKSPRNSSQPDSPRNTATTDLCQTV